MMRSVFFLFLFFLVIVFGFDSKNLSPYKFPELKLFPPMPVSETNPVTVEGAELGRYLFYDSILSSDYKFSCSSCHKQEYAFSDAPNAFSKGKEGALMKRNTMPLFNLAWYPAFFWDGKAPTIEEQIFHPIRAHNEMNMELNALAARLEENKFYKKKFSEVFGEQKIDSILISKAIAQILRALISHQSKYDKVFTGERRFTKDETDGFVLMNDQTKGDCLHCHTTDADALGTTRRFSNTGLDAVMNANDFKDKGRGGVTGKNDDNGKFKIPSLRNIALTAPYMHDGRFKALEEVLDFYSEGVNDCVNIDSKMEFAHRKGVHLAAEEKRKIICFLKTMTDSVFISNKAFSNPFRKK